MVKFSHLKKKRVSYDLYIIVPKPNSKWKVS